MRYDLIAQAFVDLISALKDADGNKLFGICRIYDGEFEQPDRLPEQWDPGTTYCLVEPRGTQQYKYSESSSPKDILAEPQIICFIGSHTVSRNTAIMDTYQRLDAVHDAVHDKVIYSGGKIIGRSLLVGGSDAKEFGMANKACWSLAIILQTRFRID